MHSRAVVVRVLESHNQGLGSRKISREVGLGHSTVLGMIRKGLDNRVFQPKTKKKPERWLEPREIVWGKCWRCGCVVQLPCLACENRKETTKRRVFDEDENLVLALRDDDMERLKEVRNGKGPHGTETEAVLV